MKKYRYVANCAVLLSGMVSFFVSCHQGRQKNNTTDILKISIHKADVKSDWLTNHTQHWHFSEKHICIVFGYGYNDENFVQSTITELGIKYGLESNGGLILPLRYPEDFKHGGSGRISILPELLEDKHIGGIILLGAPENTHNTLSRMKTNYNGSFPYPIFSYFPQDDVLGMEYVSDFVLENAQASKNTESLQDEQEQVLTNDVTALLDSSIRCITLLDSPLQADDNLHAQVQAIVGKMGKVNRYTDPETGLQSINHFVLD
jgi:hypothetical protein